MRVESQVRFRDAFVDMPRRELANHKLENNRWERFCLYLHAGKKQLDAYEQAGYNRNSTGACLLRKRPEIQARLNELSAQTVKLETKRINEDIMSELDRKVKLSKIANKDIPEPVKTSEQIDAMKELNKMDGSYPPERKQIEVYGDVEFHIGKGYVARHPAIEVTSGNSNETKG